MEHSPSDETNNETVKSKVTHDPGWNDPPIFSYGDINATALTKTPKKTLLNKRVAFPMNLQSSSSSPVTSSSDVLPSVPPSNMIPPASMPNVAATGSASDTATNIVEHSGQNLLKEGALQKVLKDFEEILTVGSDDLKPSPLAILIWQITYTWD
ncbi:hypothetical protein C0J52_14894 [Blattella germanica]|nr:hypothetical protein C0J52_14894 [Blattella germanica]